MGKLKSQLAAEEVIAMLMNGDVVNALVATSEFGWGFGRFGRHNRELFENFLRKECERFGV